MRLIYGFDPLCGWCYGFVPAMRALVAARPDLNVRLTVPGLVTGDRVGSYAEMEGYIRAASERLRAVTGRAPSAAFFDTIRRPDVVGQSAPPCRVLAAARAADPRAALTLAHLVIEAHFEDGADLNEPAIYPPLIARAGLPDPLPEAPEAETLFAAERRFGIISFPTLAIERDERLDALPTEYDPARVVALVNDAIAVRPLPLADDTSDGPRS